MGLLDFLNSPDARLGLGLLAAGGPTTDPNRSGFGQRIAGVMQDMDAQKDAAMKRAYLQSQMDENAAQTKLRQQQAERDAQINALVLGRLQGGAAPKAGIGMGGSQSTVPGGDLASPIGVNPPQMGAGQPMQSQQQGGMSSGLPGQANQTGQQGGGFPFALNDIAMLSTLGAKGSDNLFNMYKYATDGVKREAGNYYKDPVSGVTSYMPKLDNGMTMDARGNVIQAPGYSAANAGIKGMEAGAVEAAKYSYAVGADRDRQTTQAALDTVPVLGPDGQTYYQPRLGSAGMVAGRNPVTQQSAIALNDNWIKSTYQPTMDAGKQASDVQASIQAVRNIDAKTGWGTEAKANAAAMLEGMGIAPGNAKLYASNAQKFQSVAMDRLLSTLQAQKGPQTEGDSTRAQQTFAKLGNTKEANDFILDFAEAKANMDRRRAEYYEQALPLAQRTGDLPRVDREWRKIQGSIWADPVLQRWSK